MAGLERIKELEEKIKELEELKKEIEEEETRSHVRQRSEKDTKDYDYRRWLRYALRKIEEIEKEIRIEKEKR